MVKLSVLRSQTKRNQPKTSTATPHGARSSSSVAASHQHPKSPVIQRSPPRVQICALGWKIAFLVQFILVGNIFYLLFQLNVLEMPNSHKNSVQTLRESFQGEAIGGLLRQESSNKYGSSFSAMEMISGSGRNSKSVRIQEERTIPTTSSDSISQQLKSYTSILNKVEANGGTSCRRNYEGDYTWNGDYCPSTGKVTYYNDLPFERVICGTSIPPQSSVTLDGKCNTSARVFPQTPTIKGNMKPVELAFGKGGRRNGHSEFPCDIPCLSGGHPSIVTTRHVTPIDNSALWTLHFSMEGPLYYGQLIIKENDFKLNRYYSTTSYESEVPLPYFSWAEYDIQHNRPVDFDSAIKGASFIARNCNSRNGRETVVQELSKHFRVDRLSSCLHNAEPPSGANLKDKVQTMRFYLFHLAFENQCYPDYITEKLWGPLESGTIPVYYGSPNAKEHAPNNSIIMVDDFPTTKQLGEYLTKVSNDKALYEFHQQWRKEPLPPHFHVKYDFTEIHSTCRTCRWAYAKFYGLGWNHYNQSLRELVTPRYPCVEMNGHIVRPFVEAWLASSSTPLPTTFAGQQMNEPMCDEQETVDWESNDLTIDGALRRVIYQHDGVIDITIEALEAATVSSQSSRALRLETPLPGSDEVQATELELGHIRIQNGSTRFTILSWPKHKVLLKTNEEGGVVEFAIDRQEALPLRIRVVVEDVQTLRKGADKEENFFANMMKRDFFLPVEGVSD